MDLQFKNNIQMSNSPILVQVKVNKHMILQLLYNKY